MLHMNRLERLREAAGARFASLDRRLGIHRVNSAGFRWLIPGSVLAGTVLAFFVIGQLTAAPLYVSMPNGAVIALVMAGLSVACMSTDAGDAGPEDPPRDDDDTPVIGSPGGPWTVVAHLGPDTPDGAAPGIGSPPGAERAPVATPT